VILPILTQSDGFVIINKPPRLLVHRTPQQRRDLAALQLLRDQLDTRVNPIHRLDRQTSGCLLFATDLALTTALHAALTHPDAVKVYVCLVRGQLVADGPVVVERALKDDRGVVQEARSVVWCLGRSQEPRCSILKVQPTTGRTHQVRRHVRGLNHPILGDATHGDIRESRRWRESRGLTRCQLHCLHLSLPWQGGRLEATAPLYEDMASLWRGLPCWEAAVAAEPALGQPTVPVPEELLL
jgi:tRNA pseudouridine65 synthase